MFLYHKPEVSIIHHFSKEFDLQTDGLTGIYSRVVHPANLNKSTSLFTISKIMEISLNKLKYIGKIDIKNITQDVNYLHDMGQHILQLPSNLPLRFSNF